MKASSESQALWRFMTMVTTGMAFQIVPEVWCCTETVSVVCPGLDLHHWALSENPNNLLFKNLSKHKNKYCSCRYVVLQFLLSIFLSSRLVPHEFLFFLFPFPRFGHHQAAPAVPVQTCIVRFGGHPTSSVLFLSILSAFSAFSCLFFIPPESPTVINFIFFKAKRDEMS